MKDLLLIHASSPRTYKSRYKKGDKAKIRTQQYIQLNTGAIEIQQVSIKNIYFDNMVSQMYPAELHRNKANTRHVACLLNRCVLHLLRLDINKTNTFCFLIYNGRVPGMVQ